LGPQNIFSERERCINADRIYILANHEQLQLWKVKMKASLSSQTLPRRLRGYPTSVIHASHIHDEVLPSLQMVQKQETFA
jgi:hypothetical protein